MFCKWCGQTADPARGRCGACGRELPPLSECGGFYNIMPEARLARVSNPAEEPRQPAPVAPAPQTAPAMPQQPDLPERAPAAKPEQQQRSSPVPALAVGLALAVLAFLVTLVIAITTGSKLRQLENRPDRDGREVVETEPSGTVPSQSEPGQEETYDRDALLELLQQENPVFTCSILNGTGDVACGDVTLRNVYERPEITGDGTRFPNFEKKGVPTDPGTSVYVVRWVMNETCRELFKEEGHLSALLYTINTDDGLELCAVDLEVDEDAFGVRSKKTERSFRWEYRAAGTEEWVAFKDVENSVSVDLDGARVTASGNFIDALRADGAAPALRCVLTRPNANSDGKHAEEACLQLAVEDIPVDVVFN